MPPKIPASSSISRPSNLAHRDLQQPSADSDELFLGSPTQTNEVFVVGRAVAPEYLNKPVALVEGLVDVRGLRTRGTCSNPLRTFSVLLTFDF